MPRHFRGLYQVSMTSYVREGLMNQSPSWCTSKRDVSRSNPVKNNIQKFCHHTGSIKRVIIYYVLLWLREHPLLMRNLLKIALVDKEGLAPS